jgi:hypothetical protein
MSYCTLLCVPHRMHRRSASPKPHMHRYAYTSVPAVAKQLVLGQLLSQARRGEGDVHQGKLLHVATLKRFVIRDLAPHRHNADAGRRVVQQVLNSLLQRLRHSQQGKAPGAVTHDKQYNHSCCSPFLQARVPSIRGEALDRTRTHLYNVWMTRPRWCNGSKQGAGVRGVQDGGEGKASKHAPQTARWTSWRQ